MVNYSIAEEYTLPSLGKVYKQKVNPVVKIRSMTTIEEMKRLSPSERAYKNLCDIIDDCLVEKPGISAYDLCIGDYQYLLHRLRVVTYGPKYPIQSVCPACGNINKHDINLDDLEVSEYSDEYEKYLNVTLPDCGKNITLRLQTPRMLDDIKRRVDDLKAKSPDLKGEPAFLFTLESLIDKIDGQNLDAIKLSAFVRGLKMKDANYILKSVSKLDIGVQTNLDLQCNSCKLKYKTPFPITGEFFGPSID
jgi:hypothetical protein